MKINSKFNFKNEFVYFYRSNIIQIIVDSLDSKQIIVYFIVLMFTWR